MEYPGMIDFIYSTDFIISLSELKYYGNLEESDKVDYKT